MIIKTFNLSDVIRQYESYLLTYRHCCQQGDMNCKHAVDHLGIIHYYVALSTEFIRIPLGKEELAN